MKREIEIVKSIIRQEIESKGLRVLKILLFGSRAKDSSNIDSDWDFFVVVDRKIGFREKLRLKVRIAERVLKENLDCDIVIKCEEEFLRDRNTVNTISYSAAREGVEV